jgi:mono/diheme cytochrome c family protein
MRVRAIATAALSLSMFTASAALTTGQQRSTRESPLVIPSMAGQDLFGFYCATCHGRDAKGKGPVASALRTPPADLTVLSRGNRGAFPRDRIVAFIANGGNTASGAHGSNEMPVWGPIFVSLDPSDTRAMIRIENVVGYLESIQAK